MNEKSLSYLAGAIKLARSATECLVSVRKSNIIGAGHGVFANVRIDAHRPITLYPGLYMPPTPLFAITSLTGDVAIPGNPLNAILPKEIVVQNNSYCIHLENVGGSLDAKAVNDNADHMNGFMAAHKANHPPKGCIPNVKAFDFKWMDAFQVTKTPLLKDDVVKISQINAFNYGQFWYTSPEGDVVLLEKDHVLDGIAQLAGLVFVSTRPIDKDEEILFDYKIEPKCWPPWYHPVIS